MANSSHSSVRPERKNPLHRELAQWVRMGYVDRLAGAPYREEYETASDQAQANYEVGRLWASNVLAAKAKPPKWSDKTILPSSLLDVLESAARVVGSWKPADKERQFPGCYQ